MIAIDSHRVSGPAKGLLDFCSAVRPSVDPVVVVFHRGRQEETEFQDECRRCGVPVRVVPEYYRYDISLVRRTLQVARSIRPALIQTHGYKADVLGLAVGRRLGIPWLAFSHGPTAEGPMMKLYLALDNILLRMADLVVAVSEARRAALEANGCAPARLRVVHNAMDIPPVHVVDIDGVRQELGLRPDRPVIAVVGRLSPEKGHRYFIDAMAEVVRAVPGAQGLIVGEGQQERALRAQAAAMRLQEVIHFVGYRRDMSRIYPAIDMLMLPSLSEGLPNVVLEAMAYGRPVVAACVGGVPEVIENGVSGVVVDPQDAHAIAVAAVNLLGDPAARVAMGKAARNTIERRFSLRARVDRILSLYRDVLQQHERTIDSAPDPQFADHL